MPDVIGWSFALLAVCLLACPSAAADAIAVPVDRRPFAAELVSIDHDWNLVFTAEAEERSLSAEELVRWGAPREFLRGPVIVLAGGGLLAAEVTGMNEVNLEADSMLLGPITLPLDQVAGIVFQLPADPRRRTLLFDRANVAGTRRVPSVPKRVANTRHVPSTAQNVANTRRVPSVPKRVANTRRVPSARQDAPTTFASTPADRIILENDDELSGLVDRLDLDRVRLQTDAGPVEADRRNVAAVIFNPALLSPVRPEGVHAWVGLSDGSLLPAARIALNDRKLTVTTAADQTWSALPEDLVFLQPVGGRVVYLSAVEPESYRHVPYLELPWPYRLDRSVAGGRLRCGGRTYLTGLGMHTAARLTYRLDGRYERFQSEVGVDDATGGRGSVRFRVFVDGQEQFTSGPVRGGEPPEAIDLEVAGANRLDLVVDFAERAHVLDHANWLDARLVKSADR